MPIVAAGPRPVSERWSSAKTSYELRTIGGEHSSGPRRRLDPHKGYKIFGVVDVESYPAFSNIGTMSTQIDANGNFVNNNMQYSPGGPGDIVVVRLFYPWQLFVTGLGFNMSNLSGSQRLLVATAAFQNEPY